MSNNPSNNNLAGSTIPLGNPGDTPEPPTTSEEHPAVSSAPLNNLGDTQEPSSHNNNLASRSIPLGNPGNTPVPPPIFEEHRIITQANLNHLKNGTSALQRHLARMSGRISQIGSAPAAAEATVAPLRTRLDQLSSQVTNYYAMLEALEEKHKELVDEENEEVRERLIGEMREIMQRPR